MAKKSFEVFEVKIDEPKEPARTDYNQQSSDQGASATQEGVIDEDVRLTLQQQDSQEEAKKNLFLYEEDMKHMPGVSTFLKNVLSYHTTYPNEKEAKLAKRQPKKAKLGTILGVYLPTIQHIFGVLMFVRLAWIVGNAGTVQAFFMVLMCCVTTFVTAISMSAIATNGMVQAGGSYFMISRNLGPECGGAVGVCFYLANTFATDLYLLGAVEILLKYMAPSLAYFGDIEHSPENNYRVYGTAFVILLCLIVAVGVKFVQFFAPFSLSCVIISVICVTIGAFQSNADTRDIRICLVGERLMTVPHNEPYNTSLGWCNKDPGGVLWGRYCNISTDELSSCDDYFLTNEAHYVPGIPGMASGVIKDNVMSNYIQNHEVTVGVTGSKEKGEVIGDISTSFVMLCAIYFPSVTGIMTGSNMSGDLRDPQQSIPVGTILAQLTTSIVYLAFVLFFGSTTHGALLRDKFGESMGGEMLAAKLAWPHYWVVLVGAFCSTTGAALQCLTSAPRLLQAIARDNIIPFLDIFKVTTASGEPLRALFITMLLVECGVLIANLDHVAHVIDVFFVMCYAFVNLTCALQTLMKSPHWRPRFRYYHWSLSLLGVFLNLALCIIAGWYYAVAAFCIAGFIYKYVEYKGGEKEWGDGIAGLSMSAAQRALLQLDEGDPHTKNWRPQLLVLCKMNQDCSIKYRRVFSFASQLKAGKGLTVMAAVMQGDYLQLTTQAEEAKQELSAKATKVIKEEMIQEKVKGFAKVMITKDITEGLNIFIQTVGLGGMRHNAVMVGWPYGWKQSTTERSWKVFLDAIRTVNARGLALLVPRNIENFPTNKERLSGTIDVWWIVHDGGMLILLSFLLKQHKAWRQCKLRIFTVAHMADNSIQLKKDLETFLYQLRITAEVFIEEMNDNDISAYTVERTLDMEKRAQMLKELKLGRRGTIQEIVDARYVPRSTHQMSTSSLPDHKEGEEDCQELVKDAAVSNLSLESETTHDSQDTGDIPLRNLQPKNTASLPSPGTGLTPTASDTSQAMSQLKVQQRSDIDPSTIARLTEMAERGKEDQMKMAEGRLMRMNTAVRLNGYIRSKSQNAELVIFNFPAPPAQLGAEENYMEYLEVLTENIHRVLMVRGTGREVVTIYS